MEREREKRRKAEYLDDAQLFSRGLRDLCELGSVIYEASTNRVIEFNETTSRLVTGVRFERS